MSRFLVINRVRFLVVTNTTGPFSEFSLKNTQWCHTYKTWNTVLNFGHWLGSLVASPPPTPPSDMCSWWFAAFYFGGWAANHLCFYAHLKKKKKDSTYGVKMVVETKPFRSHSHLCDIQSDKIHHNIKYKNLTKLVSIRVHACYIGGATVHKSFGGTVSELKHKHCVWLGSYESHHDSASKDEPR